MTQENSDIKYLKFNEYIYSLLCRNTPPEPAAMESQNDRIGKSQQYFLDFAGLSGFGRMCRGNYCAA